MEDVIYQYCRELLEYVDKSGEIIHDSECRGSTVECTCGLDSVMNNIRTEIEIKNIERDGGLLW
jgi:hypothetical protein